MLCIANKNIQRVVRKIAIKNHFQGAKYKAIFRDLKIVVKTYSLSMNHKIIL
jgi:hypothetical protein